MRKVFLSMSLAGGLLAAPFFCGGADAQPQLPDSATLNSIIQVAPPRPAQPAPPVPPEDRKSFKKLERALKQNMQSAEALINAAREAGATPQQLADMEKFSVGFLKTFLAAITPSEMTPPNRGDRPQPPVNGMRPQKPGDRPQPPMEGKRPPRPGDRPAPAMEGPRESGCPALNPQAQPAPEKRRAPRPDAPIIAPRANPQQSAPQGMIITAPDGTQWLVTPQRPAPEPQVKRAPAPVEQVAPEKRQPPMPSAQKNAPSQGNQGLLPPPTPPAPEDEIIIIEEETVSDMPLWPTKDQMSKDGILKYLEKRNAK